jgi:hypothetical protein
LILADDPELLDLVAFTVAAPVGGQKLAELFGLDLELASRHPLENPSEMASFRAGD